MKILLCGDQHWTSKKPKNRTDDYFATVLNKLKQEIAIAKEEKCQCVIFPGDLFDSFRESHLVVQSVMKIIQSFDGWMCAVAGQHDQQFHNTDLKGTPLETLNIADCMAIMGAEECPITNGVAIYGASWKDEIPEILDPKKLNILVIHKMIVDEKLWAAQEGHTWANHLLMKTKFDLIVSGDNHNQFIASIGNRHLVNMGSMMRSTIAQVNHFPAVCVYDTDKRTIDIIDLDIKPIDEIMCLEKAEKEKEKNAQLDAFVSSLRGEESGEHAVKLSFVDSLDKYVTDNNIDSDVAKIIYEAMG